MIRFLRCIVCANGVLMQEQPIAPPTHIKMQATKKDLEDMFSHLHDRKSDLRLLFPYAHPLLRALISQRFPEKLNFKTIDAVFGAFDSAWTDPTVSSVHFSYDACVWKGTIKRERSQYVGIGLVDFTNIKLPNDGYFYTAEYNNGSGSLVDTKQETRDFVNRVADTLLKRTLIRHGTKFIFCILIALILD
jgi:hypothetical protein